VQRERGIRSCGSAQPAGARASLQDTFSLEPARVRSAAHATHLRDLRLAMEPPAPRPAPATGSETVKRSDYGKAWPFTVDSGVLACEGAGAVTFEANGTRYAVNGIAAGQDLPKINPIWRDDPDLAGLKVNIGPIIDRGLKLSEQGG
jgi:Protein of unknown function (DUF2511)